MGAEDAPSPSGFAAIVDVSAPLFFSETGLPAFVSGFTPNAASCLEFC